MRYWRNVAVILTAVTTTVLYFSSNNKVLVVEEHEKLCGLSGPLAGDDPRAVEYLRQHYLDPPSTLPYNLNKVKDAAGTHDLTWPWIRSHLDIIFAGEHGGFFIEAGALDGQFLSNTLWLERQMNWNGLLIEADAGSYNALRKKHRKSWSSNTCISTEIYPRKTTFVSRFIKRPQGVSPWIFRGHTHELSPNSSVNSDTPYEEVKNITVQCFPLMTYMTALNVSQVDLLSLDVQGSEVGIITSFLNQNKFSVRVIVAENEYKIFDEHIIEMLYKSGYTLFASNIDLIFVKRDDPLFERKEVKYFLETKALKDFNIFAQSED